MMFVKRFRVFMLGVLLVCGVVPGFAAGGRVALLIGNAAYNNVPPLENPPNDVRAFAEALRQVGFDVVVKQDTDLRTMDEAITDFWNRLKGQEAGLFYYSGHGIQLNGENFLVPTNAVIEKEMDIKHGCFPAQKLLDFMDDAKAKTNIVILDACRNNPFKRSARSAAMGLARMDAAGQMLIAYATDPDKTAADGEPGGNSPYMKHILKNMMNPGMPVERMFKLVRVGVLDETGQKQRPWELSCLTQDFAFVPGGSSGYEAVSGPSVKIEPPTVSASTGTNESSAPAGWRTAIIQDKDGYTNIRSTAGKTGAIVGKVVNGEEFYVKPTKSDWWPVRTPSGVAGFMHKSRVLLR
ncbi:MAG TPA: caspase family protein [Candidatus Ozemobacteraceae bacterium]|nr:caspase family protein [Candidatus Ozemobacteraceae bacterium]